MSTETLPAPVAAPAPPQHEYVVPDRDAALHTLLGPDYQYAHDTGLVDMFAYDPDTGEDGLLHTLAGSYSPGTTIPTGFHHGPSGEALWPSVPKKPVEEDGREKPAETATEEGDRAAEEPVTYESVTRKLPEEDQQHYPMEPSHSRVVIGGFKKMMVDRQQTPPIVSEGKYGMFPDEYDALAVLQTIRIARGNPVKPDFVPPEDGRPSYIFEGKAPLIDGKTDMTIRMVVDRETGKIKSAYPKTKKGGKPVMGLTEEQMWQHITTPTVIR